MAFFWTTWRRLEPSPRSSNIEPGLEAAVHDPLWMLCRQWQLGEFQGEDVGSPIETHLQMTRTPLTKYSAGPLAPGEKKTGQPLARNVPLEAIIESEAVRKPEAAQLRLAAESGLQFLRLLSPNSDDAARRFIVTEFSLAMPNDEVLRDYDSDTRRFLSVVAGRVPDGWLLHAILLGLRGVAPKGSRAAQISRGMQVWQGWPQAGTAPIQSTVKIWMNWYETVLFIEPPTAGNTAWLPQRMEYAAAVAAPTPGGELVLVAPEYTDGFLDWYSFDAQPGSSLGAVRTDLTADEAKTETTTAQALPVPVTFRGMPATRYWEFEDARIDFGKINAGPQQLAMLLLVEFGLVAGDDWYLVPVVAPVGALCRTDWLIVRDTFGEYTWVKSARAVDREARPQGVVSELAWDMWRVRAKSRNDESSSDVLFLPPTLESTLQGKPLEEVLFFRDEIANMAWAVERIIEGPLGQPTNRSEAYFRSRPPRPIPSAAMNGRGQVASHLKYKLYPETPPHWVPLLPARLAPDRPDILLRRTSHARNTIRGFLLEPGRDELDLCEEEVPREGARVSRAFQFARWTGGETYLWLGRRKGVGYGEGSSGLVFDQLVPPVDKSSQDPT